MNEVSERFKNCAGFFVERKKQVENAREIKKPVG